MGKPKYKQVADDVERLYWDHSVAEIQEKLNIGGSTYTNARKHAGLPNKTKRNRIEHTHGVGIERVLYHLHHDALLSVNQMSDMLGVARTTLDRWFADVDVHKRGQSEAERVKAEKISEEERRLQTEAARQACEWGIGEWVKNNPEEHAEIAKENAHKGAPAREENGMAGLTGQDHPTWRGGKSIYDAVKKQLPGDPWRQKKVKAKEHDDNTCQMCGASECKLDSHHIIPIMAGGTNGFWNLITLCESCHTTVEQYTRDLPGMESVLK